MTLLEAIDRRRSRRKYLTEPIPLEVLDKLCRLINHYNQMEGMDMRLSLDDGTAFAGFRRSYGMFSGVRNYIGLVDRLDGGTRATANTEKMGYYGELLVLHAETFGLGTCWVGGTFSRKDCPFDLEEGEMVACTITVGPVRENLGLRERLIRGITHRKTKTVRQMLAADGPVPDWVMGGMDALQKAPSAVNRQPVTITYREGQVTASVPDPTDVGTAFDLGIAKLHFELGAGGGKWGLGNGAAFTRRE